MRTPRRHPWLTQYILNLSLFICTTLWSSLGLSLASEELFQRVIRSLFRTCLIKLSLRVLAHDQLGLACRSPFIKTDTGFDSLATSLWSYGSTPSVGSMLDLIDRAPVLYQVSGIYRNATSLLANS